MPLPVAASHGRKSPGIELTLVYKNEENGNVCFLVYISYNIKRMRLAVGIYLVH